MLAACAGATAAVAYTFWLRSGKPDAPMTLNGVLGGLVGITAGCANLVPGTALLTGAVAGVLVVIASGFIEKHVDDPVGAIAVHGVCEGAWGTLAAGLFDSADPFNLSVVGVQILGIVVAFAWTFTVSYLLFRLIAKFIGLRVNGDLERQGLDLHEHDNRAYPEFLPEDELALGEL